MFATAEVFSNKKRALLREGIVAAPNCSQGKKRLSTKEPSEISGGWGAVQGGNLSQIALADNDILPPPSGRERAKMGSFRGRFISKS